jgi:poly [ADP-ribose] polymerase
VDVLIEGGTHTVGNLDLRTIAIKQIANGNSKLEELVKFLVDVNVHTITSQTRVIYANGQLKTPLGVITPDSIRKARSHLKMIAELISRREQYTWQFADWVEKYLSVVPMNIGMRFEPRNIFPDAAAVAKQEALLDAMEAVTAVAPDDEEEVFSISIKEADGDETRKVKDMYYKSRQHHHHSVYGMKVKKVFAVTIDNDKFDDKPGNVQLLWHGTKASNLLAILKGGLKIVNRGASHTTGRMFGDGLYFTDQSTKALNYAGTYWGGRDEKRYFMLLCDVAMGKAYTPSDTTRYRSYPARGYDSTFAKGGYSGVLNNEMIVYRENQARIRYIVEFTK